MKESNCFFFQSSAITHDIEEIKEIEKPTTIPVISSQEFWRLHAIWSAEFEQFRRGYHARAETY